MYVRTKAKGSEFKDDRHHFTDKWSDDIDLGGRDYASHPNLEVREDKKHADKVEVDPESEIPGVIETTVAPETDGSDKT